MALSDNLGGGTFDFAEYKRAFQAQDVDAWLAFYADDAEWIEYRHSNPPRNPNRMAGREEIRAFLNRIKAAGIQIALSDEVLSGTRTAFCVTCILPGGKRIIEHVILHHAGGKIARQVDVEAWD
jgi:ketosteroid isomerase-like protein